MYARDMPELAQLARSSAQGFKDILTFVLLTIQQPFQMTARQMCDVRHRGPESPYLFGSKRPGYLAVLESDELRLDVLAASDRGDREHAMKRLLEVPGLGLAKAGFAAQIMGAATACLDTHNLNRLGLPGFKSLVRASPKLVERKIKEYLAIVDAHGTAQWWWDTWCEYVAGRRNSPLKTADEVSRFHVEAVSACA